MKVYLLMWSMPYEGESALAVYAKAEKAQAAADEANKKLHHRSRDFGEDYSVREMEVIE